MHDNLNPLHVVGDINGIQLVSQEAIPQMHPLFLSPRVNWDDAWVHYHNHSNNQVVVFQDDIRNERHQIESFVLTAFEFTHDNQQVCPGKDGTD